MDEQKYLSEEEQYEKVLDKEKIARIKDPELRDIRYKYLNLVNQIFQDEQHFNDYEFENETNRVRALEQKEIEKYKESIKK